MSQRHQVALDVKSRRRKLWGRKKFNEISRSEFPKNFPRHHWAIFLKFSVRVCLNCDDRRRKCARSIMNLYLNDFLLVSLFIVSASLFSRRDFPLHPVILTAELWRMKHPHSPPFSFSQKLTKSPQAVIHLNSTSRLLFLRRVHFQANPTRETK